MCNDNGEGAELTVCSLDGVENPKAGPQIQRAGWLITQQNLGMFGDRASYGHALLLSSGELGRKKVYPIGQADQCQRLFGVIGSRVISLVKATFSRAVKLGMRLQAWKMNPTVSRRKLVNSSSLALVRSRFL